MAAGYDGTIRIDTSLSSTGFNSGVKGIMNGLKGVAAAIGIAFAVGSIVNFMKSCAQAASAMEIMKNRFRGVFGAEANYAEKQLGELGKKINMADDDLMSLAATLQNTFIALGFTGMGAADMSLKLTALTEELATFYGISDTEMAQTLVMALQGMTRGLKALGISINEADIKNKAMTLGLYAGSGAVSEMARAQAILALITDKTAAAQGNAEKTAHTWAGELRGLKGAWDQFKEAFGYSLIIFAPVIAIITRIIRWLTTLATYFSMVVSLLFGIKIDVSGIGGAIDDAAAGAGDLADNTAAAGAAAKGALASFDQLNVLQQDQGTGGGGGVGGGFTVPDLTIPPIDTSELDKMWAKAKILADLLTEYWRHPWETIKRWASETWTTLSGLAGQAWGIIKQIWGIAMQWMYDNVTKPIEDYFSTAWSNIQLWASNAWLWIQTTWANAWLWMYEHVTKPIEDWFSTAWENIKKWASDAWENIKSKWNVAGTWFHDNITEPIKKWFKQAWEDIKTWFSDAWENIKTKWIEASTWFQTKVIDPIKKGWDDFWTKFNEGATNAWEGFKGLAKTAINIVIGFINGMIAGFIGGINSVIGALNSIKVTVPSWIPIIGGKSFGLSIPPVDVPQIPYLAKGAVIPAHANMLAMLGEGSKREIVAPEDTIRKIITEVLNGNGGGGDMTITMPVYLDGEKIFENQKRINWRHGTSLIKGVTG